MRPEIDHVVFAWDDRDAIEDQFAAVGLDPDTGGTHDNGATHMSLLGFDDGSYVELIAPVGDADPPLWGAQMSDRGGPSAWAVRVDEIDTAVKRAIDAGIPVAGPWFESRVRPDGTSVEWDKALLDAGQNGADRQSWLLPFYLSDRTPRRYRVQPSPSVAGSSIRGVGTVVLAVPELEPAVERLQRLFRFPTPVSDSLDAWDAKLAAFPGVPVTLATPTGDDTRLAERLSDFGPGPCAYLLESSDIDATAEAFEVTDPISWPTGRAAWFDAEPLVGTLGVIEPASP